MNLNHFTTDEFDSPDKPGSGKHMSIETLKKFDKSRYLAGLPFIITSGYRTQAHNESVGGVKDSAHTTGHAADISIDGMTEAEVIRIIAALAMVGFPRIGRAKTFIHADDDPDKPRGNGIVTWDYFDGEDHKA